MAEQTSRRRRASLATGVLYSLIIVGLLSGLNFLANRYNKSYDSTANKRFTLSDQTEKIAKNLKQDVTITYWGQPSGFTDARDLLDRYKNLTPKIDVRYEDVEKNPTRARAAGVKNPIPNIFVQVGNKKEEAKGLTEEGISGALVRALKGGDRTVCFVLGSGEHSTDDTEPEGLSNAKMLAEKDNLKTQTIKLIPKAEIPKDCTIVAVSGPTRDYPQPEVDALKAYVEMGGRALFLIDPPLKLARQEVDDNTALLNVLQGWGVTAQKDLVRDPGSMTQLGPLAPAITTYEDQPIVRELKQRQEPTLIPLARALEVKNADKTKVDKLFVTSDESTATTNLSNPDAPESKADAKGPFAIGVAGTYTTGSEQGNGRFVVVGSSSFADNQFIGILANRDLYLNMLDWLSSDEDLISIRPKEPTDNPINMNARQLSLMFWSSVLGLPLLIVAFGAGVWWKRR
jgi:ABC-type uncharacterized transport system involved in gliding motility auxiliary subunit